MKTISNPLKSERWMLAREECGNQKPFLVKYCEESDYDHHGFGDLLALCGNQVKSNHCHSQDERVIIASVKRPFTIRNGDKSKKDRNGKGQTSTVLLLCKQHSICQKCHTQKKKPFWPSFFPQSTGWSFILVTNAMCLSATIFCHHHHHHWRPPSSTITIQLDRASRPRVKVASWEQFPATFDWSAPLYHHHGSGS